MKEKAKWIANLYPENYAKLAAGKKGIETRRRKKVDPLLEEVREGDVVRFYKTGSNTGRALEVEVCGIRRARVEIKEGRAWVAEGVVYQLGMGKVRKVVGEGKVTRKQGWRRA